ncbi:MAG TPA: hypothetical protein PK581_09085 [Caldisericia bacterium]|nr:hypothetical protein [Caldisericia bacterium]
MIKSFFSNFGVMIFFIVFFIALPYLVSCLYRYTNINLGLNYTDWLFLWIGFMGAAIGGLMAFYSIRSTLSQKGV